MDIRGFHVTVTSALSLFFRFTYLLKTLHRIVYFSFCFTVSKFFFNFVTKVSILKFVPKVVSSIVQTLHTRKCSLINFGTFYHYPRHPLCIQISITGGDNTWTHLSFSERFKIIIGFTVQSIQL